MKKMILATAVATPPADQATGFLPVLGLNVAFSPQAAQVTWTQSF